MTAISLKHSEGANIVGIPKAILQRLDINIDAGLKIDLTPVVKE